MGKRVHVVKRQAEYGSTEAFNWKYEEFHSFLELFSNEVCHEEYDTDNFEMPVADYKKAMDFVKKYAKAKTEKQRNKLCENYGVVEENFLNAVDDYMETTLERLSEVMTAFYMERDKKSDWIQFSAW
jgi:hypothetical protein